MVSEVKKYVCDICSSEYRDRDRAVKCESIGRPVREGIPVGTMFVLEPTKERVIYFITESKLRHYKRTHNTQCSSYAVSCSINSTGALQFPQEFMGSNVIHITPKGIAFIRDYDKYGHFLSTRRLKKVSPKQANETLKEHPVLKKNLEERLSYSSTK